MSVDRKRKSHISNELKLLIVNQIQEGMSYSDISKLLCIPKSTIGDVWKRFNERGNIDRKPGSGRPRKTSYRQDRILRRLSMQNPRKTAVVLNQEMRTHFGVSVSVSTTKRRLWMFRLFGRRPAKKPMITLKNRNARLAFARKYRNWTPDQWSKVLWSDESMFQLFGSHGIQYVRRPVNERYKSRYQIPTVKHGGGRVLVWGCFSSSGVGPLVRVKGIMDQTQYKDILEKQMLPFARNNMPRGWLFQHDNDPKHTAKSVKKWLKTKRIRILDWPAQSPDLNPIENIWNTLKIACSRTKVSNEEQKFQLLQSEWNNITVDTLSNMVRSMPRRCEAVIKAFGYPTKY